MTLPTNFWTKTATYDCIVWTGAANTKGYGCFRVDGQSELVHRLAWVDANGPIPDDMTIDHLCRVRTCVNVAHLELVTIAENNRRKHVAGGPQVGGECSRGHEMTDENAYKHPRGHIECKICRRDLRAAKKAGLTRQARAERLLTPDLPSAPSPALGGNSEVAVRLGSQAAASDHSAGGESNAR